RGNVCAVGSRRDRDRCESGRSKQRTGQHRKSHEPLCGGITSTPVRKRAGDDSPSPGGEGRGEGELSPPLLLSGTGESSKSEEDGTPPGYGRLIRNSSVP